VLELSMRLWIFVLIFLAAFSAKVSAQSAPVAESAPIAIAIHGGAGTISRERLSPDREKSIREALDRAIRAGHKVLKQSGAAVDAVTAAITVMEDAPHFNAGRGAVLTSEQKIEMDASIMTGQDLAAGAVASVRGIRHPILAAQAVLDHSPHVMLVGRGAEEFARLHGLRFMPEEWFQTEFRKRQLQQIRTPESEGISITAQDRHRWFSTVGTVALDQAGNIAAGTSTGGMSNKRFGRVGDSPIIGAGTYADNQSCAVSATGHGEFFMRHVVAYTICARMQLAGETLAESADYVINRLLVNAGGDGGVIALDSKGNIATPFNTSGMYRATIDREGNVSVMIYKDE
jgi:L-asparaginase / beta-aspartyl-peptidase